MKRKTQGISPSVKVLFRSVRKTTCFYFVQCMETSASFQLCSGGLQSYWLDPCHPMARQRETYTALPLSCRKSFTAVDHTRQQDSCQWSQKVYCYVCFLCGLVNLLFERKVYLLRNSRCNLIPEHYFHHSV